jgi:hypothetical protein
MPLDVLPRVLCGLADDLVDVDVFQGVVNDPVDVLAPELSPHLFERLVDLAVDVDLGQRAVDVPPDRGGIDVLRRVGNVLLDAGLGEGVLDDAADVGGVDGDRCCTEGLVDDRGDVDPGQGLIDGLRDLLGIGRLFSGCLGGRLLRLGGLLGPSREGTEAEAETGG